MGRRLIIQRPFLTQGPVGSIFDAKSWDDDRVDRFIAAGHAVELVLPKERKPRTRAVPDAAADVVVVVEGAEPSPESTSTSGP